MTKDPKKILDFLNMERDTLELAFDYRSLQRARDICQMAKLETNETMEVVLAFASDSLKLEDSTTINLMAQYHVALINHEKAKDVKIRDYWETVITAIENEARGR